jgi:hypothetical protein
MKVFEATVKIDGTPMKAQVTADSKIKAKKMFEGQYGRGNVLSVPQEI